MNLGWCNESRVVQGIEGGAMNRGVVTRIIGDASSSET